MKKMSNSFRLSVLQLSACGAGWHAAHQFPIGTNRPPPPWRCGSFLIVYVEPDARFGPVREAGARTNNAFDRGEPIATVHRAVSARCGAFADARRRRQTSTGVKRSSSPVGRCGSAAATKLEV